MIPDRRRNNINLTEPVAESQLTTKESSFGLILIEI